MLQSPHLFSHLPGLGSSGQQLELTSKGVSIDENFKMFGCSSKAATKPIFEILTNSTKLNYYFFSPPPTAGCLGASWDSWEMVFSSSVFQRPQPQ